MPSNEKSKLIEKEEINSVAWEVLTGKKTLAEIRGLKPQHLSAIYELAKSLYDSEQYHQAEDIFKLLCLYDPWQKNHWLGLGACRQMLGLWNEAILAYKLVLAIDKNDPHPYFYIAECFIRMGNKKQACESISKARSLASLKNDNLFIKKTEKLSSLLNI